MTTNEELIAEAREACANKQFNDTYEAGLIRRLVNALGSAVSGTTPSEPQCTCQGEYLSALDIVDGCSCGRLKPLAEMTDEEVQEAVAPTPIGGERGVWNRESAWSDYRAESGVHGTQSHRDFCAGWDAALAVSPAPARDEWEYGYELIEPDDRNVFERGGDYVSPAFAYRAAKKRIHEERHPDVPSLQYALVRRRKAGPWLPVEGEKP